jgi:hypothetical protein
MPARAATYRLAAMLEAHDPGQLKLNRDEGIALGGTTEL